MGQDAGMFRTPRLSLVPSPDRPKHLYPPLSGTDQPDTSSQQQAALQNLRATLRPGVHLVLADSGQLRNVSQYVPRVSVIAGRCETEAEIGHYFPAMQAAC